MEDSLKVSPEVQEEGANLQAAIMAREIDSGNLTTFIIGKGTVVTTNNVRLKFFYFNNWCWIC